MAAATTDSWEGAGDYESYVGRWSRLVAPEFVAWLEAPAGLAWLDAGCGTGALTAAIAAAAAPASAVGIDQSPDFAGAAGAAHDDPRLTFLVGDATALPLTAGRIDVAVSGLLLNFLPDAVAAVREWLRVTRPGGTVAAYVWDYAEGMEPIRAFWDGAVELAPAAQAVDEAVRFPLCRPDRLREAFATAGLGDVVTKTIDVRATYGDFDEYWTPFLSGVGPAPGYCAGLPPDQREALRELLRARVSPSGSGPVAMSARAFAVRGTAPSRAAAGSR
jgi:SAM-dependent methyltransferase